MLTTKIITPPLPPTKKKKIFPCFSTSGSNLNLCDVIIQQTEYKTITLVKVLFIQLPKWVCGFEGSLPT